MLTEKERAEWEFYCKTVIDPVENVRREIELSKAVADLDSLKKSRMLLMGARHGIGVEARLNMLEAAVYRLGLEDPQIKAAEDRVSVAKESLGELARPTNIEASSEDEFAILVRNRLYELNQTGNFLWNRKQLARLQAAGQCAYMDHPGILALKQKITEWTGEEPIFSEFALGDKKYVMVELPVSGARAPWLPTTGETEYGLARVKEWVDECAWEDSGNATGS